MPGDHKQCRAVKQAAGLAPGEQSQPRPGPNSAPQAHAKHSGHARMLPRQSAWCTLDGNWHDGNWHPTFSLLVRRPPPLAPCASSAAALLDWLGRGAWPRPAGLVATPALLVGLPLGGMLLARSQNSYRVPRVRAVRRGRKQDLVGASGTLHPPPKIIHPA